MIARNVRFKKLTVSTILPLLLLSLLMPTSPLANNTHGCRRDQFSEREEQKFKEIFNIISVLRSHNADLGHLSEWKFAETLWEESTRHSLDPLMVLALIKVESQFLPRAVSNEGARGLMQILPWVADALAEETALEDWKGRETLNDPIINIKLGVFYLGHLHERFGDIKVALTAYNQGPTRVQKKIAGQKALPSRYANNVLSTFQLYQAKREQMLARLASKTSSMKS